MEGAGVVRAGGGDGDGDDDDGQTTGRRGLLGRRKRERMER